MRDLVVVDGDSLMLPLQFADCTVMVPNPVIRAHQGSVYIKGKRACVLNDADPQNLKLAATYFRGAFVTPGKGEVTIRVSSAAPPRSYVQGEPLLLKGDTFTAELTVQAPAINPGNGEPDQTKKATTTGSFKPSQFFVHAS